MCETEIDGVHVFKSKAHLDDRGSWVRTFDSDWDCANELGLEPFVQISVSTNPRRGTFRGLHYLMVEAKEWKLVTCVSGSVQDILVDTRKESSTHGQIMSLELNPQDVKSLLIPPGVAHGFLTLEDNSILTYAMTAKYDLGADRGVSIFSERLKNVLAFEPGLMSSRDAGLPLMEDI